MLAGAKPQVEAPLDSITEKARAQLSTPSSARWAYHSSKWDNPYTPDELHEIARRVEVSGNEAYTVKEITKGPNKGTPIVYHSNSNSSPKMAQSFFDTIKR